MIRPALKQTKPLNREAGYRGFQASNFQGQGHRTRLRTFAHVMSLEI
jgi:hypothetical protein